MRCVVPVLLVLVAAAEPLRARSEEPIRFEVARNGISIQNLWPDGDQLIRLSNELLVPEETRKGPRVWFGTFDEDPVVVELEGDAGRRYVVQGRRPNLVPASEIFGVRCRPCLLATRVSYLTSYTVEIEKRSKRILAFELAAFCRVKRSEDGVPPGIADRECHDLKLRGIEWQGEEIVAFDAEVDGKFYQYP